MSKLGSYKAIRSLAKISLEDGLRLVNDFYWGILAATRFSVDAKSETELNNFLVADAIFSNQGRLRPTNTQNLIRQSERELPAFAILLLFSYFEPYLRSLWTTGLLGNLGLLSDAAGSVDGEQFAADSKLKASLLRLCQFRVEPLLKGNYAARFGNARKLFGMPKSIFEGYLPTLEEYYAKRNCLVHLEGKVDSRSKQHFAADSRNPIGQRVVIEHSDFLALHRAIHLASDEVDSFMVENHIRNSETLRLIYDLRDEHPTWKAKDFTRELIRLRLPEKLSLNEVARLLAIRKR